jgi:hypothetical protein
MFLLSQQKHNKKVICCTKSQRIKTLLWICCIPNILFHSNLTRFHNKTTKISTACPSRKLCKVLYPKNFVGEKKKRIDVRRKYIKIN